MRSVLTVVTVPRKRGAACHVCIAFVVMKESRQGASCASFFFPTCVCIAFFPGIFSRSCILYYPTVLRTLELFKIALKFLKYKVNW
jgi:hypothetical protein